MTPATSRLSWSWSGAAHHGALSSDAGLDHASRPNLLVSTMGCCKSILSTKKTADPASSPHAAQGGSNQAPHSVKDEARTALQKLCSLCKDDIPTEIIAFTNAVEFGSSLADGDKVHFPSPLREQEAAAAIKALEACAAAAIAKLRYATESKTIRVDVDRVSTFLMSAYLTTLDDLGKADPGIKGRIPDTDLHKAQSVLYRRMSANLYRTKNPGEYYHIHGSLNADETLKMLGLPTDREDMTDYRAIIDYIESAVMKHTAAELDALNVANRQAGIQALTWEQFRATPHGKALLQLPPLTVRPNLDDNRSTPPVPFSPGPATLTTASAGADVPPPTPDRPRYALEGIKVLELCRIIAGPTIGRSLAALGAQVLKVTSQHLPDVPFFQLDVNTGKHAVDLDLRKQADRAAFDALLADADVLIDGYCPGALGRLGYSAADLGRLARARGKGYVYVAEDCFGGTADYADAPAAPAPWATRRGWQQIADCVTGAAWAQGAFMRKDVPVVPPFPMSDYGTGALGSLAALAGLYRRATEGGSWVCRTSLCQYDVFLMRLGLLPEAEQARLYEAHKNDAGFFGLAHSDSVDEVSRRALASMRLVSPHLFAADGANGLMQKAWSKGFNGVVRWPREVVEIDGVRIGHVRTGRPNGWDKVASWEGWEEEDLDSHSSVEGHPSQGQV